MESTVAVVIPTRGRPRELARALDSVARQTRRPDEVVVVIDGADPETAHMVSAREEEVTLIELPVSGGPAAARNAGVARASAAWVAFLDDDDSWEPRKLEVQLARCVEAADPHLLVSSTAARWHTDAGVMTWPTRSPRPGEPVAEYLFVRTAPGEGMLATPTIMLSRQLAEAVPMPAQMRRHEDYEWFLRLEDVGARFEVVLQPLVRVDAQSGRSSLSRGGLWNESMAWAEERRGRLGERAFSAFVLTDVGRAAVRQGRRHALPVLVRASSGAPRAIDLTRFVGIVVLPERVRWALGRTLGQGAR